MENKLGILEKQINKLKLELISKAESSGLDSVETLKCSQDLDELIVIYQKYLRTIYKIKGGISG